MVVCTFKRLRRNEVEHLVWAATIANFISCKFRLVIFIVGTYYSYFIITKVAMLQYCYNIGYTIDEEKGFIAPNSFF